MCNQSTKQSNKPEACGWLGEDGEEEEVLGVGDQALPAQTSVNTVCL